MTDIRTLLHSGLVYLDGGMGTLLQGQGMKPGEAPERWGLTHRETIRGIHRAYFNAGSHIVMANTFGVNPVRYDAATMETMVPTMETVVPTTEAAATAWTRTETCRRYAHARDCSNRRNENFADFHFFTSFFLSLTWG